MSDESYRGELGAAQARIAQLEEKLRDAESSTSPEIRRLEAQQALATKGVPTRVTVVTAATMSVLVAAVMPVVLAEYRYEGAMAAAITVLLVVAFSAGFGLLMRFMVKRMRAAQAEQLAKKLQEARRIQRLEDEVRGMREGKPRVRVAEESAMPEEAARVSANDQDNDAGGTGAADVTRRGVL